LKLNIGYFADGPWAHETFKKIIKDPRIKISFICTRFDSDDEILISYAKKHSIKHLKNKNVNSSKFISIIKKFNCDLFVSMSFNQIFKTNMINLTRYKIINCHAGKLPFYRGRNVLNWVLINDEKEFGITVHYIDELIDNGDIILQKLFKITDKDDYKSLLKKAYKECANILYETILMFLKGNIKKQKQKKIHKIGFYCPRRKKGDENLNWNQNSRDIFNFVRAICSPGPVARSFINNKEIKINKVEYIKDAPIYKSIVGAVLNKDKNSFTVKTKDSSIKVISFQYNGSIKVGDRFKIN
jgi:methionyl-tRNA formyltransferase